MHTTNVFHLPVLSLRLLSTLRITLVTALAVILLGATLSCAPETKALESSSNTSQTQPLRFFGLHWNEVYVDGSAGGVFTNVDGSDVNVSVELLSQNGESVNDYLANFGDPGDNEQLIVGLNDGQRNHVQHTYRFHFSPPVDQVRMTISDINRSPDEPDVTFFYYDIVTARAVSATSGQIPSIQFQNESGGVNVVDLTPNAPYVEPSGATGISPGQVELRIDGAVNGGSISEFTLTHGLGDGSPTNPNPGKIHLGDLVFGVATCGDEQRDAEEGCDEGTTGDERCTAQCKIKSGFSCNQDVPGLVGNDSCLSGFCAAGTNTCEDEGIDADDDGTPAHLDIDDTDPCVPDNSVTACDSDGDGVPDGLDSDPYNPCVPDITVGCFQDLDDDGWSGEREAEEGTDPLNPDTDDDGFIDSTDANPLDPCIPNTNAGSCDEDGDEWDLDTEHSAGTDPKNPDTDGDGRMDSSDPDPLDNCIPSDTFSECDEDEDGLDYNEEEELNTDPKNPDTDGDSVSDGEDRSPLDSCIPLLSQCDVQLSGGGTSATSCAASGGRFGFMLLVLLGWRFRKIPTR